MDEMAYSKCFENVFVGVLCNRNWNISSVVRCLISDCV